MPRYGDVERWSLEVPSLLELWSTICRLVTAVIADSSRKAACMGISLVAEDLLCADGDCNSTPYDFISYESVVIRTKHRCKCSSKTPRSSFRGLDKFDKRVVLYYKWKFEGSFDSTSWPVADARG